MTIWEVVFSLLCVFLLFLLVLEHSRILEDTGRLRVTGNRDALLLSITSWTASESDRELFWVCTSWIVGGSKSVPGSHPSLGNPPFRRHRRPHLCASRQSHPRLLESEILWDLVSTIFISPSKLLRRALLSDYTYGNEKLHPLAWQESSKSSTTPSMK